MPIARIIPTILCGGVGSRLWPLSREAHPKSFIRLEDGQSLVQKAFLRGAALPGVSEVLTVTNRDLFFKIEDEFAAVNPGETSTAFILEPFGRNTAAAVAAAALYAREAHDDEALLLILAADHLIADAQAFLAAVTEAAHLAAAGRLVTFGIRPDTPETGYGYIEAEGTEVLRFVEKPSFEKASEFVASGRFYWNSGIFCFAAGSILKAMEAHCPEVLAATRACLDESRRAEGAGFFQMELDPARFATVPDISIDYAVMEKAANVAVVPCDIGWKDIGSWTALADLNEADADGNRIRGDVTLLETRNCIIQSDDRLVGAVGIENLIVVDTPDALLIADKSRAQDVKEIYGQLKAQGHEAHRLHRTVHRPWGTYTTLEEDDRFKIKRLVVKPGASLSLQMHNHRSEHWVVVSGVASVINGDRELRIDTNESTYIPAGHRHRLTNPGLLDLVVIEVQSGDYLGEDDIVRFDDIYGRA